MKIQTKFVSLAGVAVLLSIWVVSVASKTRSQEALNTMRAMPAVQFYCIMFSALLLFAFMVKVLWWDLPKGGLLTKATAKELAKREWYVKSANIVGQERLSGWIHAGGQRA